MSLVVQKYGGTSLGNAERLQNVAKIIADTLEQNRVIVVVSAMSSYTKAEGTTSRLLEAGDLAISGGPFSGFLIWSSKVISRLWKMRYPTL